MTKPDRLALIRSIVNKSAPRKISAATLAEITGEAVETEESTSEFSISEVEETAREIKRLDSEDESADGFVSPEMAQAEGLRTVRQYDATDATGLRCALEGFVPSKN